MTSEVYINNVPNKNIHTQYYHQNNPDFNKNEDFNNYIVKTQNLPEAPNITKNYNYNQPNDNNNNNDSISFDKKEEGYNNKSENKININQINNNNIVEDSSERTKEIQTSEINTTRTTTL